MVKIVWKGGLKVQNSGGALAEHVWDPGSDSQKCKTSKGNENVSQVWLRRAVVPALLR